MISRTALAAVLALPAFALGSAPVLADCAQALGMLQSQVLLIEQAAPLAADREAAPGPQDHFIGDVSEVLVERTRLAASGLAGEASRLADASGLAKALGDAHAALDAAQNALNAGDEVMCQEAVSSGLDAVREARSSL